MTWKVVNKLQKLCSFFVLAILFTNHLQAEINPNCSKSGVLENEDCMSTSQILEGINHDFQTVYATGNVTAISQPPLIITPTVTIQAPEAPSNLKTISKSEKTVRKNLLPLNASVKPSQKPHLFDVVKVLDEKGSMHLGRCLKRLNDKARERHFSGLSKELQTLETLANSSKKQINPIKKLFTQSPSQKDCINYLDFILMAG